MHISFACTTSQVKSGNSLNKFVKRVFVKVWSADVTG